MAYDAIIVERLREQLASHKPIEKNMFGGVTFMLKGNMAIGVNKEHIIVRVGQDHYEEALKLPHARVMDFTGKPMKGWVMVDPQGYESDGDLAAWVKRGVDFALTLPPK